MKKLEEILNIATNNGINTSITVGILLLVGYILGFVLIKVG